MSDLSPTLARLFFQLPPARLPDFESAYEQKLLPILQKHGLTPSAERGRPPAEGFFCRLLEAQSPSDIIQARQALERDPAWCEALGALGIGSFQGVAFGRLNPTLRLEIYTASVGTAESVSAGSGRAFWRTFDGMDGLPDNWVYAMLQDQEGVFWFGTEAGVSVYDGRRFLKPAMPEALASGIVSSMLQDHEGAIWIGTRGESGVFRYDGRGWAAFTEEDGLASNTVGSIFQDREGVLWFGTSGGVSSYDGRKWTTFTVDDGLAHNVLTSIAEDLDGALWFGTYGGVSRYDGQAWTTFTAQEGLAGNSVLSMLRDRDGALWFGTIRGVSRYDGRTFTTFTTEDGLAGELVWSIFQDQDGLLWFGTGGDGASRFDGRIFSTVTTEDGLAGNSVLRMCDDREGHLWFGTGGAGVSRYSGPTFASCTAEDGLAHDEVRSILRDQEGVLWFGTYGGGVSRYDGRGFTTLTEADGLVGNRIRSMCQDRDGCLWLGTTGGVSRYDGQCLTSFTTADGLLNPYVFSVFQDREGHLWFGTQGGGVSRYDGERITSFTTQNGLADNRVRCIFQDRDGTLWFGGHSGVARYDGEGFTIFTEDDGLADNNVRCIFQDREGYLWFGTTGGGVSRYNGQTFATFTVDDGLAHNVVISICEDQEGHLWFGTWGGASRYDGQVFQRLTRQDGLASNAVWSVCQGADGDIWFGTADGATRFHQPHPVPPSAAVDAVVADRRYDASDAVTVPATGGLVTFEFHGSNLKTRSGAMAYRYRLKGCDDAWTNTFEERVEYQDLPAGEYTFEVLAVDRDLVYSEAPATVKLTVSPDARDARIEELERRVRERTEKLEEANARLEEQNRALEEANRQVVEATRLKSQFLATMSHELRTPMNAIIGFTRIVLRRGADALSPRHRENLQKVMQSADDLLTLINDILDLSKIEAGRVDVKPSTFALDKLIASCCATVAPSLGKASVDLRHEVTADVGEATTDEARLRQVVINLLTNALKFTEEGEVVVKAKRENGALVISVSDTGIGIPEDAQETIFQEFRQVDGSTTRKHQGTGLGLSIVRRIAELLGGTISLESEVGVGSTFTVRIPVTYGQPLPPRPDAPRSPAPGPPSGGEGLGGRTLVSIDDDPNVAVLLREELAEDDYRVVSATNADEGVALVRKLKPVAVTVDIVMPGKDGWETIAMLKADPETRDIPVIVLSVSDNRDLGYRLGVSDYLVKPVDRDSLLAALGRLDHGAVNDVLVVDDDRTTVMMLSQMLEMNGFAPRGAHNGQEALDQITERQPDAILLDLMMPVMDGFEVVERLEANPDWRDIPVVVVTAKDLTPDEVEFLHQRVSRVVQKGDLDPDDLGASLREILKRYHREG